AGNHALLDIGLEPRRELAEPLGGEADLFGFRAGKALSRGRGREKQAPHQHQKGRPCFHDTSSAPRLMPSHVIAEVSIRLRRAGPHRRAPRAPRYQGGGERSIDGRERRRGAQVPVSLDLLWPRLYRYPSRWGCSSVGRAQGWQSWGQGFEPPQLHQKTKGVTGQPVTPLCIRCLNSAYPASDRAWLGRGRSRFRMASLR